MTAVTNATDLGPESLEWVFDHIDDLLDRDVSLIAPIADKTFKDLIYVAYVGIPGGQGLFAIGVCPATAFDELYGVCCGVCPGFRVSDGDASIVEIPTGMYLEHYKLRHGPFAASVRKAIIEGDWRVRI